MIILGLGSNMDDRLAHLQAALAALGGLLGGMRCSNIYESKALLPPDAPFEWDRPFYNMVVCGKSPLAGEALLLQVKKIEQELGRREVETWSPRPIDIDILAVGEHVCDGLELTVPHGELLHRNFVMVPFAELLPDWRYPAAGKYQGMTASEIVAAKNLRCDETLRDTGIVL